MSESQKHFLRKQWRLILTIATFIVLVILIYSLRQQISSVISELKNVNAMALLLVIPLQVWNYDAYARFYRSLFKTLGETVDYRSMYRFTLELNFVNHILPSGGVSGISYFNIRMRSLGVSTAKSTLSQVLKMFLLYLSFQPLLILGLYFLAIRGHVSNLIMVVASSLITLLVVGTFIGIYIIESRERISAALTAVTKTLNWLIHLVRPKKPETINIERAQRTFNELHDNYQHIKNNWRELKMPFFYMMLANITEIASVYVVYIAFGEFINLGAVILAYAVANFAGLMSVLPAGIGVYEGLMTAVLAATGVPAKLSIPVTLMYRIISMAVQLIPGYALYQRALKNGLGAAKISNKS